MTAGNCSHPTSCLPVSSLSLKNLLKCCSFMKSPRVLPSVCELPTVDSGMRGFNTYWHTLPCRQSPRQVFKGFSVCPLSAPGFAILHVVPFNPPNTPSFWSCHTASRPQCTHSPWAEIYCRPLAPPGPPPDSAQATCLVTEGCICKL